MKENKFTGKGMMTFGQLAYEAYINLKVHPEWKDLPVLVTDDEEGNGYHGLYYTFRDLTEDEYPLCREDIKKGVQLG